jgi:2-polyprenyl-3-methyl-5-hydroxy-6-metoxy-1,4-benzoquinol methylase
LNENRLREVDEMSKVEDEFNPNNEYQNSGIAKGYDAERFTSFSERLFDRLEKQSVLKALSKICRGKKILDLPTGTGRHAENLLAHGFDVLGADISQEMLDVAKVKLEAYSSQFSTLQLDVLKTPSAAVSDIAGAICIRVLMHFPLEQQIVFLRNVAAMSPKGVVFNQSLITPWHRCRRRLKSLFKTRMSTRHPLTSETLNYLLEGAGLEMVYKKWVFPFVSEAIVIAARPIEKAK